MWLTARLIPRSLLNDRNFVRSFGVGVQDCCIRGQKDVCLKG
jgi:hypothetical protein